MTTRTRLVGDETIHVSIDDNLSAHERILREAGATEGMLQPLREAAAAVRQAECTLADLSEIDPSRPECGLAEALAPVELSNGWRIDPPSMAGRQYAEAAVRVVTGGIPDPDPELAAMAMAAALWTMLQWQDGRGRGTLMRAVFSAEFWATALPERILPALEGAESEVTDAYCTLMGIDLGKEGRPAALARYRTVIRSVRRRLEAMGRTTLRGVDDAGSGPCSSRRCGCDDTSGCDGETSGTGSRR